MKKNENTVESGSCSLVRREEGGWVKENNMNSIEVLHWRVLAFCCRRPFGKIRSDQISLEKTMSVLALGLLE